MEINTKNNEWLKYVNTILLAIIMSLSVLAFSKISAVHDSQEAQELKLVEVATKQVEVMKTLDGLEARVLVLEINYQEQIKTWVEANFQRKTTK